MSPSSETEERGACRPCGGHGNGNGTWWKGDFFEGSEERIARRGQRKAPRCAGERLQRAEDIAK